MHKSSYQNMKQFVEKYLNKNKTLKILDIGSQDVYGSYKDLFKNPNWKYYGLDMIKAKNVDIVIKNIYSWKEIRSKTYDVVISGQALEHIEYPWLTMKEIKRILKSDGLCCIIAPSSGPEHKYPIDCYRFFPDGLKALAKYVNLDVIDSYNCWDNDSEWKDSVLICKNKKNNFLDIFK
jgi:SAM-dependent methyltransferase